MEQESERKDEEIKETELEIEVQQCSHMVLDLENLKRTLINLGTSGATKIDIGAVYLKSEDDVICEFTEKPCVLHRLVGWSTKLIKYSHRERCPSSEGSTKKYKLRGEKNGSLFYVTGMKQTWG